MQPLYPKIKPYAVHQLEVDEPHVIYIEESGEPDGIPVLFVHGGPGAGTKGDDRRFFDPERYRIILFDQRGCGKSAPHAALNGNTTQALVSDMEAIRDYLQIDKWVLFGGSWGATLSLVYAQAYPNHILHLILRGIFLGRESDIHWLYQQGANYFFPDSWQEFLQPIPETEHNDLISAYHKRLAGGDDLTRMAAAKAWSLWEGHTSTLTPHSKTIDFFADPITAMSLARIETHYFMNHCFLESNQILNNVEYIADVPSTIIHGRYDMVCRLDSAWDLQQAWPASNLHIVRNAGHAASEPATTDALIHATKEVAKQLR